MLVPNFRRAYSNDKGLNCAIYNCYKSRYCDLQKFFMSVTRVDVNKYRYTQLKNIVGTGTRSSDPAIPQKFETKILKAIE